VFVDEIHVTIMRFFLMASRKIGACSNLFLSLCNVIIDVVDVVVDVIIIIIIKPIEQLTKRRGKQFWTVLAQLFSKHSQI
jgi:hypothetical protein